jgi:monoterpene epsilon-lactone hydrolase
MENNTSSDLLSVARKAEISHLLKHLEAIPWPEGIEEARIHYDALGTPIAPDIHVEKVNIGHILSEIYTPPDCDPNRIMLYLHGGGFVFGSSKSHGGMVAEIARYAQCKVLFINYRRAPEHPFPAALQDSCAAYHWLRNQGYQSQCMSIAGDSAGGGLVLSTLLSLREQNYPLPGSAVCISPWTDQEFSGESYKTRKEMDPLIEERVCQLVSQSYLNGHDKQDPLVSPILADLSHLPPLFIQVGEREVLYNDAADLAQLAKQFNLDVTFEEWPDMVHVWHFYYKYLSDGIKAMQRVGKFVIEKSGNYHPC